MSKISSGETGPGNPPFVFIGFFMGLVYWILEAYFDTLFVENSTFGERIFPSDPHELWMRGLAPVLLIGIGLYAHFAYLRLRSLQSLNEDAAWLLRNAISKTIRGNFPICVYCKKIRDEDGIWFSPERFIVSRTDAEIPGSICDDCHADRSRDHKIDEAELD